MKNYLHIFSNVLLSHQDSCIFINLFCLRIEQLIVHCEDHWWTGLQITERDMSICQNLDVFCLIIAETDVFSPYNFK